jgi:alcohol dehydrogenase
MRAAIYESFQGKIDVRDVESPIPTPTGVVLSVKACGICRSDWHGWMGNDPDIRMPHVPGHEIAGVVEAAGSEIANFKAGDRVTLPFVCGCGSCEQCASGNQQICDRQFQPGFTAWGGFAQFVAIEYADNNLVRLSDDVDFATAASLGCRFATSFRAVVDQGKVAEGQWVAVHGCGGVGLSAVMIATALGARVIAIDVADGPLELARAIGAEAVLNAANSDPIETVRELSGGGVHVSIDALGHPDVLLNSVSSLRKSGKHIQVGIMEAGRHLAAIPVDKIIGRELEIIGSHGMQAHRYPEMLEMIEIGVLEPKKLVGETISLDDAPRRLISMGSAASNGISVIDFSL